MLRLFAIVGVLAAFGAALYFSGDYLQAWESPETPAKAAPAPRSKKKEKAKPEHPARRAKKEQRREAAWLTELNALCIRNLAESDEMEPPSRPEDVPRFIRRFEGRNIRANRQATELVQRSGNAKTAKALRGLFDQEEQLVHSLLNAAQNGEEQRLRRVMRSLLAVGKSENKLLTKLGAVDCTVPADAFELS
jgi:hypothetical protein